MADLTFTLTRTGDDTTVTCNTCGEATTGADTGALITYLTDDHTCDTLDEPIPNPQPQTRIANPTDPDDRTDDATALPGTTITRRRPSKVGRPPHWTDPRLLDRIIESVAGGSYLTTAATSSGLSASTLFIWLKDAQAPDAPIELADFRARIERARGMAEETAVTFLWDVARGGHLIKRATRNDSTGDGYVVEESFTAPDAKPVQFLLERSFPQRWSRRSTLDVGFNPDGPAGGVRDGDEEARLDALAARTAAALAVVRGVVIDGESESA